MNTNQTILVGQVFAVFVGGIGLGAALSARLGVKAHQHTTAVAISCAAGALISGSQLLHWGVLPLWGALIMAVCSLAWVVKASLRRNIRVPHAEP